MHYWFYVSLFRINHLLYAVSTLWLNTRNLNLSSQEASTMTEYLICATHSCNVPTLCSLCQQNVFFYLSLIFCCCYEWKDYTTLHPLYFRNNQFCNHRNLSIWNDNVVYILYSQFIFLIAVYYTHCTVMIFVTEFCTKKCNIYLSKLRVSSKHLTPYNY